MNPIKPLLSLKSSLLCMLLISTYICYGQNNVNSVAFPFLLVNADARSGGMGNLGVTSSPDAFSQYWNPAKYLFTEEQSILGVGHVPYGGSANTTLSNISFYSKGKKRGIWSAGVNYFNYGELNFTELVGGEIVNQGSAQPAEWNANVSFSLLLGDHYSMGVTTKYINSNVLSLIEGSKSSHAIGFDITGFYQKPISFLGADAILRSGFALANLGPRINYGDGRAKEFLPANFRTGIGFSFPSKKNNQLSFNIEITKLLVPKRELVSVATQNSPAVYRTADIGFISGIFKSLSDSSEFSDLSWSYGLEYLFAKQFALRAGYFTEQLEAGNRAFLTLGTGFKLQNFNCNFSYVFGTANPQSLLQDTLRFSVAYTLKSKKEAENDNNGGTNNETENKSVDGN